MDIKKVLCIAIIALLLSVIAYDLAETNNVFNIVVNNTNLYPSQRLHNTTYYTNSTPIEVFLIFHVIGTGASIEIDSNVSINGTTVLDKDYRTTAGAGIHEHFSYSFIVPKNTNYNITNSTNVETIEWREYPILSGKNGTLSINQTVINQGGAGGGVSFNGSAVDLNGSMLYNGSNQQGTFNHSNLTNLNWSVANHTIDSDVVFYPYNISIGDGSKFNNDPYFGLITKATSFSNITMFVRTTGTDTNNNCISSSNPCLTIQHAVNNIPGIVNANIIIDINGTFNEAVDVRGKAVTGNYRIKIRGNSTDENFNGTVSGCRQGTQSFPSNITVTGGGMTTNQYRMSFVKFYSGNNIGIVRPIHSNNATQLNVTGKLPSTCSAGDGIAIYTIPEKISPTGDVYSITLYGIRSIDLENINLTKGLIATGSDFAEYNIYSSSKNHYTELASTYKTYDSVYDSRCAGSFTCMIYSGFSRGEFYRDLIIGNGTAGNYMYLQSSSSNIIGEGTIIDSTQYGARIEINSGVQIWQGGLGIYPRIINQGTAGLFVRNIGSVVVDTGQAYFNNNPVNILLTYNLDAANVFIGSDTGTVSINGTGVVIPSLAGVGVAYTCVNANGLLYRGSPTC